MNLLKAWKERESTIRSTSQLVRHVLEEDDSEGVVEVWKGPGELDLMLLDGAQKHRLQQVFVMYPDLFLQTPGKTQMIQHIIRIRPDQGPVCQRPYRIPERLLDPLKEEIRTMIRLGVFEPSESEWSSAFVIVPKKDRSLQICIEFRKINAISQFVAYPMPRIDNLLDRQGQLHHYLRHLQGVLAGTP